MSTLFLNKLLEESENYDTYLEFFNEDPKKYNSTEDKFIKLALLSDSNGNLNEFESNLVKSHTFSLNVKSSSSLYEVAIKCLLDTKRNQQYEENDHEKYEIEQVDETEYDDEQEREREEEDQNREEKEN